MSAELTLDEMLVAFAAGTLPEPVAVAVATHLALSAESRAAYRLYEALGGVLLEEIEPAAMRGDAWEHIRARLGADTALPAGGGIDPKAASTDEIPLPLRPYMPGGLEALRWRNYPGVAEAELEMGSFEYRARLINLKAGRRVLRHTHRGHEITVVLKGSFHDELGRYRRGDISITDERIDHQPVADAEGDCLCLAITDAPLKLTGRFARFLNPLLRA